jgi:hypothetical protein
MVKFDENIVADMRGQYSIEYVSQLASGPAGHAVRLKTVSPENKIRSRRNTANSATLK